MAKFTNLSQNFTMIPNWLINNQEISLKAKGLFIFLASKPDDFNFSAKGLSKLNKEGVTSINNCLKELENIGLLIRKKIKGDDQRFIGIEYILMDKPLDENSVSGKPTDGKPTNINNKDLYKKDSTPHSKKLEDYLLLEVNESVSEIKNYEFLQSSLGFRNLFLYNCNKLGIKNISQLENPNYIKFSDPLRLLIEKDKYTIEDLRTVYDYLKNSKDDFWKAQILSTNNLRDKFNKLIASANIDKKQAFKTIKKPTLNI